MRGSRRSDNDPMRHRPCCSPCRLVPAMLAVVLASGSAGAQGTFFVRTSGSDSNDGLTSGTAFGTVQKAVRSCTSGSGGYTIYVGPGNYEESVVVSAGVGAASGVADAPNRIIGDVTGAHTGDTGGPVVIDGRKKRDYGIQVEQRSYWSFSNLTVRDQKRYGFYLNEGRGFTVADCTIRPSGHFGIFAQASDILLDRNEFVRDRTTGSCISVIAHESGFITARRNRFCLTGSDYLSLAFARGFKWSNIVDGLSGRSTNISYGICAVGKPGSDNDITIENNVGTDCYLGIFASASDHPGASITIASNTVSGCFYPVYFQSLLAGPAVARNNIATDSFYPVAGIAPSGHIEGTLSHNITTGSFLSSGVRSITGGITADPRFRSPAAGDFSLLSGSPALDAGVADSGVGEDIAGTLRPIDGDRDGVAAIDIGAYESRPTRNLRITRAVESMPPLASVRMSLISRSTTLGTGGGTSDTTVVGTEAVGSLLRSLFPGN